jgi:hypothetical protein
MTRCGKNITADLSFIDRDRDNIVYSSSKIFLIDSCRQFKSNYERSKSIEKVRFTLGHRKRWLIEENFIEYHRYH